MLFFDGLECFLCFFSRVSAFFLHRPGRHLLIFSYLFTFLLLLIEIPTFSCFSGFFASFRQMQEIQFLFFPNFLSIFLRFFSYF